MITGDSSEYNLLEKWSKNFDCQGYYSCEIGVREGQGSKIIMDNVAINYFHIGVDPYGDIQYKHFDGDDNFHWTDPEGNILYNPEPIFLKPPWILQVILSYIKSNPYLKKHENGMDFQGNC